MLGGTIGKKGQTLLYNGTILRGIIMTKGIVHLKISCGLLAAVALIVGCTTEDGVVDVSACATDGVAELSAMCNDSWLSVSLKNTGKKPILVDRELVFL